MKTRKWLLALVLPLIFTTANAEDCVVLLHGLASHPMVMKPLELAIDIQPEFRVVNQGYNSYSADLSTLAAEVIPESLAACDLQGGESVSFVTHSMGGLLLRAYIDDHQVEQIARAVMIAPPNHGSEIVDWFQRTPGLVNLLGPAGKQLGTEHEGFVAALPLPSFELGIVAGTQENKVFWRKILPEENDGKVSAESAQITSMSDFKEIEAKHSELLYRKETIEQVMSFLRYGRFGISEVDCVISD